MYVRLTTTPSQPWQEEESEKVQNDLEQLKTQSKSRLKVRVGGMCGHVQGLGGAGCAGGQGHRVLQWLSTLTHCQKPPGSPLEIWPPRTHICGNPTCMPPAGLQGLSTGCGRLE